MSFPDEENYEEREMTPAGEPIYRYEEGDREFEAAVGDEQVIEEVEAHIEKYFGEVSTVLHEIISDLIHIDLYVIKPTPERDYYTIITCGMSERPMTAPDEYAEWRYGELMISLPPDWPMTQEDFDDNNNYWPIHFLKMLARFPHEYETCLAWGHSMPNGDPPEPVAENTELCGFVLLSPILVDEGFAEMKRADGNTTHFYSLIPIYAEEMDLKINEGLEPLIDKFEEYNVSELLDPQRPNSCV